MSIRRAVFMLFASLLLIALFACGNGGSGWQEEPPSEASPPDTTPPDTTPPDTTPPDTTPPIDEEGEIPVITSVLSDAAASLLPGQTVKIPSEGLMDVARWDGANILQWGREGSWSIARQQLLWIGAQHGNEYYHYIVYDAETNTWAEHPMHPDQQGIVQGHGYEHNTIDHESDDFYFRPHTKAQIYRWVGALQDWQPGAFSTILDGGTYSPGGFDWWPGRGLVYADRYGVRLWEKSSETWRYLATDAQVARPIGIHEFGEYVPGLDVYLFGGGSGDPYAMYRLDRDDTLTMLNDAPVGLGSGGDGGVFVADPNGTGKVIHWNRSKDNPQYYEYDVATDTWTPLSQTTTDDQTVPSYGLPNLFDGFVPSWNSGASIAFPIPDHGVIAFIGWWSDDIWLYKHSVSFPSAVTTFDLTSAITGDVPFTTAVGFKKGDVPDTPTLDLDTYQVEVKRRWSDNSVKHAIFSGVYPSVAGQPTTVSVLNGGDAPTGTALTEADIVAAAPTATVALGAYGTVSLADLLGDPQRIWLQGPELIEAHYQADVGADPVLSVWFYVRLYKDGRVRVRTVVENGVLNDTGLDETKIYSPVVRVGGSTVYDHGGLDLTHYAHTRWSAQGWIGISDPQLTVVYDTRYLRDTKLVPNYWKEGPSDARLNSQYQAYKPMEKGNWTQSMGSAGHQDQIGLLPNWDALYINSNADPRAYRAVIANAESINSYGIVWSDPATHAPLLISEWPTWTINGPNGSGGTTVEAGALKWEIAHHPSAGYLPYLITGDYYYLESMQYNALLPWLLTSNGQGQGADRVPAGETRGVAWVQRTIGQLTGLAPQDSFTADMTTWLGNIIDHYDAVRSQEGMNGLGYFFWKLYSDWQSGTMSIFQQHFWMQTLGMLSDIEALPDMTQLIGTRDHLYQAIVGLFGGGGAENYCYTRAGWFYLKVTDVLDFDATTWYDTWGQVWQGTHDSPNPEVCGTALEVNGTSILQEAHSNIWGIATATLSYAVEDGAPGAAEAWQRFISADNFNTLETSGFEDISVWNITPRNATPPVED